MRDKARLYDMRLCNADMHLQSGTSGEAGYERPVPGEACVADRGL